LVWCPWNSAAAMFKLKENLRPILLSQHFPSDVARRQSLAANMEKPAARLVDAAIKMDAKIVSVGVGKLRYPVKRVLTIYEYNHIIEV